VTVTYASAAGTADIASGYVQIDGCNIEWDRNPNGVQVYNSGDGSIKCSGVSQINNSSIPGNPNAMSVQFTLTFSEQNFVGTHELWSWATNAEGLESPHADLGALVVNQGQDFVLNISPADSSVANIVPIGGTLDHDFQHRTQRFSGRHYAWQFGGSRPGQLLRPLWFAVVHQWE
jgi:hypothetical protein